MRKKEKTETTYDHSMKMLPHDLDTEEAVLATIMRYNDKFAEFSDMLSVELFYYDKEQTMFRCIEGVINDGGITDINSLFSYYQSHDFEYELFKNDFVKIFQLSNTVTLEQDIRRLMQMSKRRILWKLLMQASGNVLDVTLDLDEEVNGILTSVGEVQSEIGDDGISSFSDAFDELREMVNDNANGKKNCLQTGFRIFDNYFLLRPNTLTVIAAFTSVGKSALAMNIAVAVSRQKIPVAYYSLEMGKAELASRSISKEAGVPASILMNKQLTEFQLRAFDIAVGEKKDFPIYFDDRSTVTFDRTIRSIRTMVKTRGIKLAVIDYLQIYAQLTDNAEQSIAYMARAAKNIAKEMGIAVVLLSQLNRSAAHPSIKMLRGSGQIEESADNIVLIDRPEAYPDNNVTKYDGEFKDEDVHGTAKFILAKGRGVGTGCTLVGFDAVNTRFYELQKPAVPFEIPKSKVEMEAPF